MWESVVSVDFGGAAFGFLLQVFGDAGIKLVRGTDDERALRAALAQTIARVVEQAAPPARRRLELGIRQCFEAPRVLDIRKLDGSTAVDEALRESIRAQVGQLKEMRSSDTGRLFYDEADLNPEWVSEQVTEALVAAIRHQAAASGLVPLVQALDAAELTASLDEVRQQLSAVLEAIAGQGHSPAREVSPAPNVPRQPVFVGRAGALSWLDAALGSPGVVVVHGLGGIGKSSLAARWAALHADECTLVRWIMADTAADVDTGLAAMAEAMGLVSSRTPLEERPEHAMRWLSSHTGWLLVLDNVAQPADIASLLNRIPGGRVLITTRLATGWHHVTTTVLDLHVLTPVDALDLFTQITGNDLIPEGAAELCAELGWLPLAIEQAAGYLQQTRVSPTVYQRILANQPAAVFNSAPEGSDSQRTIARIWRVTLDRLTDTPLAGHLLRVLAWYGSDAIPRSLLTPLTGVLKTDADGAVDELVLLAALGRLAAYHLITFDDGDSISIHRLVQTITRTSDPDDPHRRPADINAARELAAHLLNEAAPKDTAHPVGWLSWRRLLPHITALIGHVPPAADTSTTAILLNQTGLFFLSQRDPRQAALFLHRATAADERILGPGHPDTLISRSNLAAAYKSAGDLDRAIPLHEQTLTDRERLLGADHPDTLSARSNLAGAYESAGDLDRAIPIFQQTFLDSERVLGADHPNTLSARSNLAGAYESAGDLDRAIPLHEQTLTERERLFGVDHPDTLSARSNLAGAYESAGDLDRAIPLFASTLTDRERVLGVDHLYTMGARNNLAHAYKSAGDLDRAIPMYEQTLTDRERVQGVDHPSTLSSRNNLATAYKAASDLDRAIPLYEQTYLDSERVLGADHPSTLNSRNNLADAYKSAGDLDRAIPLFEQTYLDSERVHGVDHPSTLSSRNNLADAYKSAGDLDRAIPWFEVTLTDRERVLGTDHPDTLNSRNNLAAAYASAGDLDRATPLFEVTLTDRERVLGTDHPDTLNSRNNLAYTYKSAGDLDRAIPLFELTLTDRERLLGADHLHTLNSRNNLATAYESAGDLDRATSLYQQTLTDCDRVLGPDHGFTRTVAANLARCRPNGQ